jgi:hypothetical protein
MASRRSARPQRTESNAPLRCTFKGEIQQKAGGRLANALLLGFLIRHNERFAVPAADPTRPGGSGPMA